MKAKSILILWCVSILVGVMHVRAAEETPVLMMGDSMMRLLSIAMEKQLKAAGVQPASSFTSLASVWHALMRLTGLARPPNW